MGLIHLSLTEIKVKKQKFITAKRKVSLSFNYIDIEIQNQYLIKKFCSKGYYFSQAFFLSKYFSQDSNVGLHLKYL